ncbi:MAG: GGDEF domain [Thermodesulfobacterium sp.]|uniref:GGDEF domain n=1 Tax=Candidatus Thermodesulfobacterium syntrophicum TaxID=3060442 RepID=A0AAE3TEB7_9BACT|nr:GGDEF domain [Candidatus Thermodesulfobacterium syntrophicum]
MKSQFKLKVCSCQKDNINFWKDFAKALEFLIKRKVNFELIPDKPFQLKEKVDLFFASFSLSLELLKKNYQPIAKIKGQKDNYLVIGIENLEKIKEKEKIKILILNHPFSFLLLFFLIQNFNIDFLKILVITVSSYEEIFQKILNKEGDLGIVPEKRIKSYLNKFLFVKKIPIELSHYFLVSTESGLTSEIKKALLSINKNIEPLTLWEKEFIKNSHFLGEFIPKLVEKCTILETFLNSPHFGIGIYHDTYIYANSYLCNLLNYPLEELKKLKPEDILYYEKDKIFAREIVKRRLSGKLFILPYQEKTLKTKDGKKVEALLFTNTIFYQGKYCGMIVVINITKQKILEKLVNLLRNVNQILITCNSKKEFYKKICPEIYKILELKSLWLGKANYEKGIVEPLLFYPENLKLFKDWNFTLPFQKNVKIITNIKNSDFPYKRELLSLGVSSIAIIPIVEKEKIKSVLVLCSEEPVFMDEIKDLLEELQIDFSFAVKKIDFLSQNYILNEFIKDIDEILIICDEKGNIEYVNPFGFKLLSKLEGNLLKTNCFELLYLSKNILKELEKRKEGIRRIGTYSKPGKEKLILDLKISLIELGEDVKKLIILGKDLTKEFEFEKEKHALQYIDSLTGLLNYFGFSKRVSEVLSFLKVHSLFIIIDFYNFSYINRFYGLEVGDFCLKELAKKLNVLVGKKGIVGRTGGDEFSLFLINIKADEVAEWLNKIKALIYQPLKYKNQLISLEFNAAVVSYPDDGKTFEELWEKVNVLLLETKKKGANVIEIFNPLIENEVEQTFKVNTLIKKALKENLFVFYYQPYFETKSLKIAGVEALVRIKDNEKLVLPSEFIKHLENSPYLIEFENFNFRKNLENLKNWKIPISINISSKSFKILDFKKIFSNFKDTLSAFPFYLILEITEHTLAENIKTAKEILKTIKSFNIKIALDDFGVGYSSLNYLKDLPIDILKIDISFTKSLLKDIKTYNIVKTLINLAKDLNLKTIAEGVETEEQLKIYKDLKCDYVQGFFLSSPLPEKEMKNLLKTKK